MGTLSGATIIRLDRATLPPRLAARAAARSSENEKRAAAELHERERAAAAERAYWLADLATWPEPFRRRLRPLVEHATEPDEMESRWIVGAALIRLRRNGGSTDPYADSFARSVRTGAIGNVRTLPNRVEEMRRARPGKRRDDARKRLEAAKADLLMTLWSWGRRRIERREIEVDALEYIDYRRNSTTLELEKFIPEKLAALEVRLASGDPYVRGPKKGQRRSSDDLRWIERRIAELQKDAERCRLELAELNSEPDPLRLVGFYGPAR